MLTLSQSQELIELVEHSNIEHLVARTGHGLLSRFTDKSTPESSRLYMGLEGHTEAESNEAMLDWNWKIQEADNKPDELLHRHKIEGLKSPPQFHGSDIFHYTWMIMTIAPLCLEIHKTPDHILAELVQPLPKPTNMLRHSVIRAPFCYELHEKHTLMRHPFHGPDQDITVSSSMRELYLDIWKECTRMYYLYCETLDEKDAFNFMVCLYRKQYR